MKRIRNIMIVAITSFAVFAALEFYIKWAYVESVSHSDYDEDIGRIRRAGMKYVWNEEGLGVRQYNDFGYLGPSYPPSTSDEVIRIALIGDSFVEGFQVFERNHFRSVLERTLQSYFPGKRIEVLNFGRSGFNICKMYCYHQDFVKTFSPDLSVYIIANEDYVEFSSDPVLPNCYLESDSVRLDYSFRESAYVDKYNRYKFLTQNFASLQLLRSCLALINRGKLHKILLDISYKANYQGIPELNEETLKYYMELTTKLFDKLDPNTTMIFHRSEEPLMFDTMQKYYRENGFTFHDIQDTVRVLENMGMETRTMFSRKLKGHWNYESHRIIGQYLARKIHRFIRKKGIAE